MLVQLTINSFLTADKTPSAEPVIRTASDDRTFVVVVPKSAKADGKLIFDMPARALFADQATLETLKPDQTVQIWA